MHNSKNINFTSKQNKHFCEILTRVNLQIKKNSLLTILMKQTEENHFCASRYQRVAKNKDDLTFYNNQHRNHQRFQRPSHKALPTSAQAELEFSSKYFNANST